MRKLIYCLAASCVAGSIVYAGPEALPAGKEMKQVVPTPPACPQWSGFYAGAFGGYKFSSVDANLTANDELALHGEDLGPALESFGSHDLDNSGAELGGMIGYNYQLHNNWVFGLEAAGGYLWARESDAEGLEHLPISNVDLKLSSSFKTHYLVTVAPRIGYAFCRWLPYVTGGAAFGDLDFTQSYAAFRGIRGIGLAADDTVHDTNVGWMVGGGLEYALTNHWRLRGQYQYIDLGDVSFDSVTSGTLQGATIFGAHHRAELREHNASVGILYQF
jgi:outer membrane immunogenic protein